VVISTALDKGVWGASAKEDSMAAKKPAKKAAKKTAKKKK
jgi:hypothetical protein